MYYEVQKELAGIERLASEYKSPKTQRLIEIGRATEKAFENQWLMIWGQQEGEVDLEIYSASDLLEWSTQEGKAGEGKE